MQPSLPDSFSNSDSVCPFLGVSDDPGTALSFPSASNLCYHAKPIASVKLAHQAAYCLVSRHEKCPVFKTAGDKPLPIEIKELKVRIHRRTPILALIIGAVVILLAVFLALQASGVSLFNSNPQEEDVNLQAFQTITQMVGQTQTAMALTSLPTPTPQPSPTGTDLPATPVPTSFPPHELEVPFGSNPRFVIHTVQAGESYMRFIQDYNTTREAILAVNYGNAPTLWAGSLLIIPFDTLDATGIPAFTAYQITEQHLTVEALAANQQADVDIIRKYNALPAGYIFTPGEWVLIPH
jgi:LysM repeat protein